MTTSAPAARILIVDDSMGVARALSLGLGLYQNGLYQAEMCYSGEEALKRVVEVPFDLLISDLRLPGIDGLSLLDRVRQISPQTRSILITAYGSPDVEERGRNLVNAYLPKPFMLRDIICAVERVLAEPPRSIAPGPAAPSHGPPPPGAAGETEKRKAVHLTVFACDLDGTLTQDGQIAPSTWDALRTARSAGMVLILVTGRSLDSFLARGPFGELFEAIVAENGAVVLFPRRDMVVLPFGRVESSLLRQLELLNVPLERGMAIAATVIPHDETALWGLRESRCSATIEYNRSALMLLPAGASKASGLLYALDELGYSPHNVVGVGDAENDRSLFEVVELAVAVANADPALRKAADIVLPTEAGAGVKEILQELVKGDSFGVPNRRPRGHRSLVLGQRASGTPVRIDPFALVETNVGIFGSSGSGKSWLAGLLAEELLKQKYQICIIDPEGEYRGLGTSPRTLLLGGLGTPLPSVSDVLNVAEWNNVSLVLDLSMYAVPDRLEYVEGFLRALRGLRSRRGRPHFFLVDEIQSFCPPEGGPLTDLFLDAMQWGGFGLVSYRPSLVSRALLDYLDHFLITHLALPEEIEALRGLVDQRGGDGSTVDVLPGLERGQAYLYTLSGALRLTPGHEAGAVRFGVGGRAIPHIRHLHKYLRAPLPEQKRFYFRNSHGQVEGSAANLWEFWEQLGRVSDSALGYHLVRGDFGRWCADVLHDDELARRIDRIASRGLRGEPLREALREVAAERYNELEARI